MANYTFFRRGAEWSPGSYMVFRLPQGPTRIAEYFDEPVRFGPNYVTWGTDPLRPTVTPGPGAKPGGTDPTNPRRLLVERRQAENRKNLENQAATGLIMALAAYYS